MHRVLIVRPSTRRLRVLATGDSMIQIIDGDLQRRLGDRGPVSVRSDAHISTGISKPFMFDWIAHARGSARTLHPDVTVMFLGANDGFPMGTRSGHKAPCCGGEWVREYARRARTMMRSYARRGAGTVYWLLLPAPRGKNFQTVFGPVNRALRAAARSFPGVVHLVDLGATFTPGGKVPPDDSLAGAHRVGASAGRGAPFGGGSVDRHDADRPAHAARRADRVSPRLPALLMAGWLTAAMAMTACGADKRPRPPSRPPSRPRRPARSRSSRPTRGRPCGDAPRGRERSRRP